MTPGSGSLLDLLCSATGRPAREYSRTALVVASHEIEDRYGARATPGSVLFGGFQRGRFFETDLARWTGFAHRAAVAVAAYGHPVPGVVGLGPPIELRVGPHDPFWRDWLCLAYDGGEGSGVVIARDLVGDPDGGAEGDRLRRCAGLVSHDPRVARIAAAWVAGYLAGFDERLARHWSRALPGRPPARPPVPRALV